MSQRHAADVLKQEFLEIRCRLLDIAAALDRIDRAGGAEALRPDPGLQKIRQALDILRDHGPDRARRIQMVFSDPYEPDWRSADS